MKAPRFFLSRTRLFMYVLLLPKKNTHRLAYLYASVCARVCKYVTHNNHISCIINVSILPLPVNLYSKSTIFRECEKRKIHTHLHLTYIPFHHNKHRHFSLSLSLTLTKWNHKYPNVLAGSQLLDIEKPKRQLDMRIEMCFRMCMAPDAYDLHCSEHQEKNHIWRRDAAPTSSRWMLPGIVCEKKWARASATVRERESEHFEG